MQFYAKRPVIVLFLALLLMAATGSTGARPTRHQRKAPAVAPPPLGRADRLLVGRLAGQLAQQAAWGWDDLTAPQWDALIAVARQFQKAKPAVVRAALFRYWADGERNSPAFAGSDMTKALLLFRLMFVYPKRLPDGATPGSDPAFQPGHVFFMFGTVWAGMPIDAGAGKPGGSSPTATNQTSPAWPVAWRDGRPHVTARLVGIEGAEYQMVEEYQYALHHFPVRDLAKVPPAPGPRAGGTAKESEARRVALERYRFLQRLEPRFGGLPLSEMAGSDVDVALFPLGRADRVYIFEWAAEGGIAFCFQRKGGRDRLDYRIALAPVERPAKRARRVRSLLDYIRSTEWADNGSYVIHGRISRSAWDDLAAGRECAIYCVTSMGDELVVGLLSDVESVLPAPPQMEHYALDRDPVTGAKLKGDEFFRQHGLPVAKKERTLMSDARK